MTEQSPNRMLLCAASLLVVIHMASAGQKILKSEIKAITLHKGKYTEARRTSPIPQLRCLSGCAVTPDVVQCYNRGTVGADTQWECKARLAPKTHFGPLSVSCEGYDFKGDDHVLYGSCGLEYSLVGEGADQGQSYFPQIIIAAIVVFFLYSMCSAPNRPPNGGGGGGGNFGGGYGAPPGGPPGGPGFRDDLGDGCAPGPRYAPRADNAGPGFWSGAATGGLLGYLFGQGGTGYGGNYERAYRQERAQRSSAGTSNSNSGSSYGGCESSGYGGSNDR